MAAAVVIGLPLGAAAQQGIGWPEAVARLAAERTRAEGCAARAKSLDAATADSLGAGYTEAKAEIDGVIAGLSAALAEGRKPAALADLEKRLTAGFDRREQFCRDVIARLPPQPGGEKGVLGDLVGGLVKPLIEAVVEIWMRTDDNNTLRRDTIRAQLEATRWPGFASVQPLR